MIFWKLNLELFKVQVQESFSKKALGNTLIQCHLCQLDEKEKREKTNLLHSEKKRPWTKDYYQAFFWVLIDLIVELLGLIIKPFDNQTES